jgi:hypothetical protein
MNIPNPKVNIEAIIMPKPIKDRIKSVLKSLSKKLNKRMANPMQIPRKVVFLKM